MIKIDSRRRRISPPYSHNTKQVLSRTGCILVNSLVAKNEGEFSEALANLNRHDISHIAKCLRKYSLIKGDES